jgi:predicted NACHT family NTPase
VQGRAGIGKTTFVRYVGYQWSKGQLYAEYTWVFTLTLRKLRLLPNNQELSLSEWIRRSQFSDWPQKNLMLLWRQRIEPAINQNKVLLILDGYDEAPENHPCKSVLKDLLTAVGIYANFSLLITTRPSSAGDITEKRRNLEIIGFTDENINQYIQTYFLKAS